MSIPEIQKRRVVNEILQKKFAQGHKPTPAEITKEASSFFYENKIGSPYNVDDTFLGDQVRSDPEAFNQSAYVLLENLTTYYLSAQQQIGRMLTFSDYTEAKFKQMDDRRQALLTKIEDYLLSIFNSDGYFYSHSDSFRSISFLDTGMTTAFVNTELSQATIPVNTNVSRFLRSGEVSVSSIKFYNDQTNKELTSVRKTGQDTALFDGLSNTVWSYEVSTSRKIRIRCEVEFSFGETINDVSKVSFEPFGVSEAQYWMTAYNTAENEQGQFGGKILTTLLPFSFSDESRDINGMRLNIRKTDHDYEDYNSNGSIRYNYIFGFKNISVAKWIYENAASLVTNPISLPGEIFSDQVIDAVSLAVDENTPRSSSIEYYVAADDGSIADPDISSFDWKRIVPIKELTQEPENIVRFSGANKENKMIRRNPSNQEIQLDPFDTTNTDLSRRNPNQVTVPGVNVYSIAPFSSEYIPGTLELEEGVDTARVTVLPFDNTMLDAGLDYWTDYVKGIKTPVDVLYKNIRYGSAFFYGGDMGTAGRSVHVETYIDALDDYKDQVRELVKDENNVRQWGIKLYLNGLEVADLPVGKDRDVVSYNFRKGLNHIVMTISVPPNTSAYPNVYVGSIDLMNSGGLQNYGTVRLNNIKYVDFFDFKYNYSKDSNVFTIDGSNLLTYIKPTDNYRLSYVKDSSAAPPAIRFRADFFRDELHPEVSPVLNEYRLRFAY